MHAMLWRCDGDEREKDGLGDTSAGQLGRAKPDDEGTSWTERGSGLVCFRSWYPIGVEQTRHPRPSRGLRDAGRRWAGWITMDRG